jgi:hypothetical protein
LPDALTERGAVWMKKKDYARALTHLDQSIAVQPSVLGYFARAQVHETQGKSSLAIADFRKALELQPKNVFDVAAQAFAKSRLEVLSRRDSYGKGAGRCLWSAVRVPGYESASSAASLRRAIRRLGGGCERRGVRAALERRDIGTAEPNGHRGGGDQDRQRERRGGDQLDERDRPPLRRCRVRRCRVCCPIVGPGRWLLRHIGLHKSVFPTMAGIAAGALV